MGNIVQFGVVSILDRRQDALHGLTHGLGFRQFLQNASARARIRYPVGRLHQDNQGVWQWVFGFDP